MAGHPWSRSSSVRSTNASNGIRTDELSAALTGASLAFGQHPEKKTLAPSKTYSGRDGALTAAAIVVRQKSSESAASSRRSSPSRGDGGHSPGRDQPRQLEGSLLAAQLSVLRDRGQAASRIKALEALNTNQQLRRVDSPSNTAALTATARLTPQNSGLTRTASYNHQSLDSRRGSRIIGHHSDTPQKPSKRPTPTITPDQNLPRTLNLQSGVDIENEYHYGNTSPVDSVRSVSRFPRQQQKEVSIAQQQVGNGDIKPNAVLIPFKASATRPLQTVSRKVSDSSQSQTGRDKTAKASSVPASVPPTSRSVSNRSKRAQHASATSPALPLPAATNGSEQWYGHRSEPSRGRNRTSPAQSISPPIASPTPIPGRGQASTSKKSPYIVSHMTGDSLADAIVASSLASSRAPSPTKIVSPPVPKRHSMSHLLAPNHRQDSRTPSPSKMKQTLRKHTPSDDEDDPTVPHRKSRKSLVRKHPNKHHEGDRKRWRDVITERERKRYEGVWAANRGILTQTDSARVKAKDVAVDLVFNLIVRDIWSRSRLQKEILEEIWDLVAQQYDECLARDEFVVGLWLIDQSLKGRKLPNKVSPSVWSSVRNLRQLKIPRRKG